MIVTEGKEPRAVTFVNHYPDDIEWSAHIHILNEWTPEDYQLRHIVGYIQAGPHYPKHMHQNLIEQWATFQQRYLIENVIVVRKNKRTYSMDHKDVDALLDKLKQIQQEEPR